MVNIMNISALALTATSAVAAQYTGGDTAGCGKSHIIKDLTIYRSIESGGVERKYGIHLPSGYNKDQQYPTIVGFHGSDSIGFFFQADTKLNEKRFTEDKIMVYPDGLGGNWAGANYSETSSQQDLQFVWDMLSDIRREYCIDSARIYATGMSNGGGFVDILACNATVGGEFAAFAPASGAFHANGGDDHGDCKPARVPTPILEFHGGSDESVFYEGGEGSGGRLPSIESWLESWAERNECSESVQEDLFDEDVHHLTWACSGQNSAMEHYKTDSQKHCWASTEPNFSQLAAGDGPTHVQASELIQDFFMTFARPEE